MAQRISKRFEWLFTELESTGAAKFTVGDNGLKFRPKGFASWIDISPNGLIVWVGKCQFVFGSLTDLEIFIESVQASPEWHAVINNWAHNPSLFKK